MNLEIECGVCHQLCAIYSEVWVCGNCGRTGPRPDIDADGNRVVGAVAAQPQPDACVDIALLNAPPGSPERSAFYGADGSQLARSYRDMTPEELKARRRQEDREMVQAAFKGATWMKW